MILASLAVAALFALVHVASPSLARLDRTPRSVWLSIGGGISTAYVFVHLLPELAALEREALAVSATHGESTEHDGAEDAAHHGGGLLFLVALGGLVLFYGLERLALIHGGGRDGDTPAGAFWLHLGSFALYNLLIGALLHEQAARGGLWLYALAMGVHFVVNDRGLYAHHGRRYLAAGRWLLAAAVLIGWALGQWAELPPALLALLIAFLAGGVVLNVIKEELPEERESRYWAFLLGTAGYALLLVLAG